MHPMPALSRLTRAEAQRLSGLLFDLDDTLLDRGLLAEKAYSALFRLRESRLRLVVVTGRPAGWGEVLARQWPIDGAVTENGAIGLFRADTSVRRLDPVSQEERRRRRRLLASLVAEMRAELEDLHPADDVEQRISDFTFDIGESRRVPAERVARAVRFARERGASTSTSSVHLHVSFDAADKAAGAVRLLRQLFGEDATALRSRYAFIGDSENDAACFAAFGTTFGVANTSGRPTIGPRFLAGRERGAGFAEVAEALVRLRSG
jgi:hypothetical protein